MLFGHFVLRVELPGGNSITGDFHKMIIQPAIPDYGLRPGIGWIHVASVNCHFC